MAKTGVEIVCSKCGAEIREGSVYCYGCGSPVAEVTGPEAAESKPNPAEVEETKQDPISDLELAHSSAIAQSSGRTRPKRQKVTKFEPKVVEVVWKEPETGSWRFVIAALVFVILGIGLVAMGLYLR